jgi:hypothetical protein
MGGNEVNMTVEHVSMPMGESGQPRHVVSVVAAGEQPRRLDQLSPLIHELLAWDLVHLDESGTFVLHDDVQQRLKEVSALRPTSTAQVYVGRQCERCGVVSVTRLIDGARVCSSCNRSMSAVDAPVEPQAEPSHGRGPHSSRSRWHRKAG